MGLCSRRRRRRLHWRQAVPTQPQILVLAAGKALSKRSGLAGCSVSARLQLRQQFREVAGCRAQEFMLDHCLGRMYSLRSSLAVPTHPRTNGYNAATTPTFTSTASRGRREWPLYGHPLPFRSPQARPPRYCERFLTGSLATAAITHPLPSTRKPAPIQPQLGRVLPACNGRWGGFQGLTRRSWPSGLHVGREVRVHVANLPGNAIQCGRQSPVVLVDARQLSPDAPLGDPGWIGSRPAPYREGRKRHPRGGDDCGTA